MPRRSRPLFGAWRRAAALLLTATALALIVCVGPAAAQNPAPAGPPSGKCRDDKVLSQIAQNKSDIEDLEKKIGELQTKITDLALKQPRTAGEDVDLKIGKAQIDTAVRKRDSRQKTLDALEALPPCTPMPWRSTRCNSCIPAVNTLNGIIDTYNQTRQADSTDPRLLDLAKYITAYEAGLAACEKVCMPLPQPKTE